MQERRKADWHGEPYPTVDQHRSWADEEWSHGFSAGVTAGALVTSTVAILLIMLIL